MREEAQHSLCFKLFYDKYVTVEGLNRGKIWIFGCHPCLGYLNYYVNYVVFKEHGSL
jgi:hypothetical protein